MGSLRAAHAAATLLAASTAFMAFTWTAPAHAAPFIPSSDAQVVERLPGRAGDDPALRRVDSLRRQLAAQPQDAALRTEIARRYFDLAMAQGDPRYAGYASGAIAPLAAQPPSDGAYWLVRGMLEQYNHNFEAALSSLARAMQADPQSPEPLAWRAAIYMVQARAEQAQAECERMAPLADRLWATGCRAYAQAARGALATAYAELAAAAGSDPTAAPPLRMWIETRLAEMAIRLQRPALAERHFRAGLDTGVTDQFLLGAYADFLLAQGRPAEVLTLLAGWERSDILLLRLALAGQARQDARAADWARQLRERFQAAARRGDRLHEWEAARFELEIDKRPEPALALARSNYSSQREPRDAMMLMRTALAAGKPAEAEPALAWLRASGYEDPTLAQLASQLVAAGAKR